MAVTRIQSVKVSNIAEVVNHRLFPPEIEEYLSAGHGFDWNISEDFRKLNMELWNHLFHDSDPSNKELLAEYMSEVFRIVESKAYRHKIRKNATLQEIVIAYSRNEFDEVIEELNESGITTESEIEEEIIAEIEKDVEAFKESFRTKYGFYPYFFYFVHKDNRNKYHVHILFSLMKPQLDKKVRWRKRDYFDLIKRISKISPRISPPSESKGIGAYPLWLIRRIELEIGRERAKILVERARKKGVKASELLDWVKRQSQRLPHQTPEPEL